MKNFVKVASLAATLALAACQTNPNTNVMPKEDAVNSRHVANTEHQVWKNGTDDLCWQTGYYPDGNAVVGCDATATKVVTETIVKQKSTTINFDANALFDFNKSTLRPMGQQALAALATALKSVSFDQTIVVGHTDSFGSDAYNDRLSLRRAEAVKAYLVSQGINAASISTSGMGERQLLVQPLTKGTRAARIAAEQPNRRVSVDVRGVVIPANQVDRWNNFLKSVPGVNVNVVK
ncbi:OmpA family protein [Hydromonas duriensis]|uniref:OOP family OmpA-OmpF porin n=1 Tax=Hydromonas duriensis TaxID=1527608 RepID=A0A4R6Y2S4_9BURK|nr:OmpA family protein [Hydromonas duriensis]TDR30814.1 OOP family OmpA-OmpF porin [Hydromonas duriensis]